MDRLDKRTQKTKRAIRKAFLSLLTEKDVSKVTVKEIADIAEVDRKTVYNYYAGVREILEELENELIAAFKQATQEYLQSIDDPMAAFAALYKFLNENYENCSVFMRLSENSRLLAKVVEFLRGQIRLIFEKNPLVDPDKIDIATEYVTAGAFSAYRYWFNSKQEKTLEEINAEVADLTLNGITAYLLRFPRKDS